VAKKRPVRDQILAQVKAGDTLTVWKLDRLGRSVIDLKNIVTGLEQRGVKFRSLTEHIDTSTAQGRLFFDLLAAFAEFERQLIIERTTAGKRRMIDDGEHPGGVPMYGFEADHVTIIEAEAERLREAGRRLIDGQTLTRIVDGWNDQGLRPRRGRRWGVTPLRGMLINPRVVPIIGQDTYDKLVRLFATPGRKKLGRVAEHLLSGILRCGREGCGQAMYLTRFQERNGTKRKVYKCKKREGSGGRFAGCGRTVVSAARADAWAEEAFIAAVCSEEFTAALNRRRAELLAGEVTVAQVEEWRAEVEELELVLPTRFGTEAMRERHEQLQRMVRQATAGLLQRPDLQVLLDLPKTEEKLRARWNTWTLLERRSWLKRLLVSIVVKPAPPGHHHRGSDVESRFDPTWRI
jgi:DNA invertase Pin-like site-specific DNA recombinase